MSSLISISSNNILKQLPEDLIDELVNEVSSFKFRAEHFLKKLGCYNSQWYYKTYEMYKIDFFHPVVYILIHLMYLTDEKNLAEMNSNPILFLDKYMFVKNNTLTKMYESNKEDEYKKDGNNDDIYTLLEEYIVEERILSKKDYIMCQYIAEGIDETFKRCGLDVNHYNHTSDI
jgi:hypothetical protein